MLYQKCTSDDHDVSDVNEWIRKVFDSSTAEEVMKFAAELGVFVLYDVDVFSSPLRMVRVYRWAALLDLSMGKDV